jgi:hypothetical protein
MKYTFCPYDTSACMASSFGHDSTVIYAYTCIIIWNKQILLLDFETPFRIHSWSCFKGEDWSFDWSWMLFEFRRVNHNSWLREDLCWRIRLFLHLSIFVADFKCLSGSFVIDSECAHQIFLLGWTPLLLYLYHRDSDLFNYFSFINGPRYLSLHYRLLYITSTIRDCR